jgi:hypothetical protein
MMSFSKLSKLNQCYADHMAERRQIIDAFNHKVTVERTYKHMCEDYPTRTLRLMNDSYNDEETANALYEWEARSSTEADEDEVRELIAFGVRYRESIGKRMLKFAINRTKIAHPRFFYHDLSEMEEEDAAAFKTVLSVLVDVYLSRREARWKPVEDSNWNHSYIPCAEEARKAFSVASEALVDIIMSHADRADEISDYIIRRQVDVSSKDIGGLEGYLESESLALAGGAL